MHIEKLLKIKGASRKEILEMIISNHITHYLGDRKGDKPGDKEGVAIVRKQDGAVIGINKFGLLADDILKFYDKILMEENTSTRQMAKNS